MTGPWARPEGSLEPVFDIPLTGPDSGDGTDRDAHVTGAPAPNWRKVAGLSALAGIAIGLSVAVVIATTAGDEADDAGPGTTLAGEELAAVLTTPPTLPPVVGTPTPPPDASEAAGDEPAPGVGDAPAAGDARGPTIPTFPVVAGVGDEEIARYDLAAAVAANVPGTDPMRAIFTVDSLGAATTAEPGSVRLLTVTVANEPDAGRDSLVVDFRDGSSQIVVDRTAATAYTTTGTDPARTWSAVSAEQLIAGTGAGSLDALFDTFVAGPVSEQTVAASTVTASDEIVRLAGGAFGRRFDLAVPSEALRPYGILLFTGFSDEAIESGAAPPTLTFQVYVTGQPAIALITSRFEIEGQPFLLSQFFDRHPANVLIRLPSPETVVAAG